MDAASAAAMSDPERNPLFRRRWLEPAGSATGRAIAEHPGPDDDLAVTGLELREQWRQERALASGCGSGERGAGVAAER